MPTPAAEDTAAPIELRGAALWVALRAEYITDPSQPTYEQLALKYSKNIGYEALRKRACEERWIEQREAWWADAETTLLERIRDSYLLERVEEMRKIREAMPFVFEHLLPVMENDPACPGQKRPKRDPETGMPVFRHSFKSQEGVTRVWLLLQERNMLLRGEATSRTASAIADRQPLVAETDPLAQMAAKANFSPAEVRALARQMVAKRMREEAGEAEPDEDDDVVEATSGGDDEI